MAVILNLETSTKNCSVSIASEGKLLAVVEESSDQHIHSEKLHLFIEKALREADIDLSQLEAVAVGKGPGSYTGLRIGVSAAKGLCYALNVPLISEDGLQILVHDFLADHRPGTGELIIPMLDARRMEVYCAVHQYDGRRISEVEARIIDSGSFRDSGAEKIHLIGDAVEKCKEVLSGPVFVFHEEKYPSAAALAEASFRKFQGGDFEDVAYFEPFYLKDFIAGKPKKLL